MSIDLYFSNTALYQDSVKVVRERSCCSKERNVNLTKIQNQLLYMFDVVKKKLFCKFIVKLLFYHNYNGNKAGRLQKSIPVHDLAEI